MECAPVEPVVERRPFVFGHARLHRDIGLDPWIILREQRLQFTADDVRLGLDLPQPREMRTIEELVGRQERDV
jgi:hypothetical protein